MTTPAPHGGFRGASGAARVLVVVYAILALGATGRSAVQLLTHAGDAPLAYGLSAFAAVVYVIATVALVARGRVAHAVASIAIGVELAGVLVIGSISLLRPDLFPADTVWSGFGRGYLFVPLVLPLLGIAWLETQHTAARRAADGRTASHRTMARTTDARHH